MNQYADIIKKSKEVASNNKETYVAHLKSLQSAVSDLSLRQKKQLYSLIATKVDITSKDPFSSQSDWLLIGVILGETNDKNLIAEILTTTPPQSIGALWLKDYIATIDPEILSRVIRRSALERANLSKQISKLKKSESGAPSSKPAPP